MRSVRGIVEELKVFERNKVPPPFELRSLLIFRRLRGRAAGILSESIPSLKPLSGTG